MNNDILKITKLVVIAKCLQKVPKRQRICRILRIIIPNIDVCDLIRYNI